MPVGFWGICSTTRRCRCPRIRAAQAKGATPGRPKEPLTLFGLVALRRNYYYWASREQGRAPLDQALGLWAGYSPGVLRIICRAAARHPFDVAAAELKAYCGLQVEGRQIQRIAQEMGPRVRAVQEQLPPFKHDSGLIPVMYIAVDGTGVPMRPEELEGRAWQATRWLSQDPRGQVGLCVYPNHP